MEPRDSGAGMRLRALTAEDISDLSRLQPPGWFDIRPAFAMYVAAPYTHPVKCVSRGVVVGTGAAIEMGRTGWIAHVIVHPEYRRRGIGAFVTESLIATLREKECRTLCLVATEEGVPLYKRFGFVEQTCYEFFMKEGAGATERIAGQIRRVVPTDNPELLDLDALASGEERSRLITEGLASAWVYDGARGIEGFYAPSLGEGLVIATSGEAGAALLSCRSRISPFGALPVENTSGIAWYKAHGYYRFRRAKRMVLGPAFPFHPDQIYGRIGGNFG